MGNLIIREDNTEEIIASLDNGIQRALEKIGLTAESYAKKAAPVDTGRLRNSITHVVDNGDKSVAIGTNVEYAPYQELGTRSHSAANGGKGFLRPAATDHVDKYRQILKSELGS